MHNFYERLCEAVGSGQIRKQEPMAAHTTFCTGGPAAWFVEVGEKNALRDTVLLCREQKVPFYILGNGSNLLVSSKGYDGVMIKLVGEFLSCEVEGEDIRGGKLSEISDRYGNMVSIRAGAGLLLSRIGRMALENSLSGFEFASGIPGTLGGAVVMNAGAYGGEMKDILSSVCVMTENGEIKELSLEDLDLSYRHSCILEKGYIVLSARMNFRYGDTGEIESKMQDLAARRREKQPLEYPSAGSTFKRPEGYFAGKLIEDAELKGFSIGGAQVSEKHAGFVINRDHAVPEDVRQLIREVQRKVLETSGVFLEPEVKFLGFEEDISGGETHR